jgi:hypothetical protein
VITRSPAERLDEAVDGILSGAAPAVEPELRPLVDAASLLRAALPPLPAGERFEARLASRLLRPGHLVWLAVLLGHAAGRGIGRAMRHPGRSLAAVGGVLTALAALVAVQFTRRAARRG